MKSLVLFISGAAAAFICVWLASCGAGHQSSSQAHTFSSFDSPRGAAGALQFDTGKLSLADADLNQVLNLYSSAIRRMLHLLQEADSHPMLSLRDIVNPPTNPPARRP